MASWHGTQQRGLQPFMLLTIPVKQSGKRSNLKLGMDPPMVKAWQTRSHAKPRQATNPLVSKHSRVAYFVFCQTRIALVSEVCTNAAGRTRHLRQKHQDSLVTIPHTNRHGPLA